MLDIRREEPITAINRLNNFCQSLGITLPQYEEDDPQGPPHNRVYTVRVISKYPILNIIRQVPDRLLVNNMTFGQGREKSKKAAKEQAAKQALDEMNKAYPGYRFHIF